MTEYINKLLDRFIVQKDQKNYRIPTTDPYAEAAEYQAENLTDMERSVRRLTYMLEMEQPHVYPDEKIALIRTVQTIPEIFTEKERQSLAKEHYIHEQGKVCNINPEYMLLVNAGFDEKRVEISKELENSCTKEKETLLHAMLDVMDSIQKFAECYRKEAEKVGNKVVAETFSKIPAQKPETFLEALQFLRLVHYCLWSSFNYHNTLGRFDQYMFPYFDRERKAGTLTEEEALELLEEFFISCNKDSDLYTGMQQGDNGQSIVLGGLNPDGTESFNELSRLCMQASLELKLIDPKINLRVNKNTPVELYEFGSKLTRQGLGFPQYLNDDVVIPCLKKWGYEDQDAYNYAVAACWEHIIPGRGTDIPNINTMSYVRTIVDTLEQLPECESFDQYLELVHQSIREQAEVLMNQVKNVYMEPAPLMSLMMQDTIRTGRDVSKGNYYNNYGFHGAGLSTAVDSLAAIRKYVFEDKMISGADMADMCRNNFRGHEDIQNMLRYEAPKMGNDDDKVDELAVTLLDWFADALEGRTNDQGGIFRAGTGSAMYYVWDSKERMATPDGRREGEELACNYSPSLFIRCDGPVSILKSFAKPNLERVANGGPLTIELSDTMFRNDESIKKVGMFVKSYIDLGGYQMQINAVNREKMLDAKAHPENYRNLIVRVWGWSGYFVELDECYQDHIIKRMELAV
ncbi:MAG: pyruvate formate lyase family protein [Eubacteriales bacterium]|nr:pyruvate formate lyase family protein [Eubacteriales bacterium]